MAIDLPPISKLWLPPKPAIVRPADKHLLSPDYLPVERVARRAALNDLVNDGRITREQARAAIVFQVRDGSALALTMMARMAMVRSKRSSGAAPSLFTFLGSDTAAGASTTRTISSAALGPANSARLIIVVIGVDSIIGAITAVTVGGVAAADYADVSNGAARPGIWGALVPTGTTGNIVVTFTATPNVYNVAWYSLLSPGISDAANLNFFQIHPTQSSGTTSTALDLVSSAGFSLSTGIVFGSMDTTASNLAFSGATHNGKALTTDYESFNTSNFAAGSGNVPAADGNFVATWASGGSGAAVAVATDGTNFG